MKKTNTPLPIKDADEIINDFLNSCDIVQASTVFSRMFVGYSMMRTRGVPLHPADPCNQDTKDEKFIEAIRAIRTMLYEIERTMKAEVSAT